MQSQNITSEMKYGSLGNCIEPVILAKEGQRDVADEADRSNKEWQKGVNPDLREVLVKKLAGAIMYSSTRREKDLGSSEMELGRKIEAEIFRKANNADAYYGDIGDTLYRMRKFGSLVEEEDKDIPVTQTLPQSLDWSLGTPPAVGTKTLEEETDRPIITQYLKEWQQRTTPDLRTLLVRKLAKAMLTGANESEVKKVGFIARKMEWEIFDLANDKSEYYQLIEEKLHMFEKEREAKQLLAEEQQKSVEKEQQEPEKQEQQPQLEEQQQQPESEAQQQPELEEQQKPELEEQQKPELEEQQQHQSHIAIVRLNLMVLLISIVLGVLYELI